MAVDVLTWDALPPEVEDDTDLNELVAQVARSVQAAEDAQGVLDAIEGLPANVVSDVGKLLLEGVWDPDKHPRWPTTVGPHKKGQFIRVGERFLWKGIEYEIAHVFNNEIVVHRATGNPKESETIEIPLKPGATGVGQTGMTLPGAKEAPIKALKGTHGKGNIATSDQTVVDPYVHSNTHDPAIPIPAGSKLTPEQWKRFGRIDQLNYQQLQQRYGSWTSGKSQTLSKKILNEAKQEFGSSIVQIVTDAFGSQLGTSTGNTLSLTAAFQSLVHHNSPAQLEKLYRDREKARIVQGEYRSAVQWDLYNRTGSPDIILDHGDNNHHTPQWWDQNFISGPNAVMPGLSMTHHYRGAWWGDVHLILPVAIRHVLMNNLTGGTLTSLGSSNDPNKDTGEQETSIDYQFKPKPGKTLVIEPGKLPAGVGKWLQGATVNGAGGEVFEKLQDVLGGKDSVPLIATALHITLEGSAGQALAPPAAAAKPDFYHKVPAIHASSTPPGKISATDNKQLPWLFKNTDGTPKLVTGTEAKAEVGQYFMGKQGTLYWIGPNPGSPSGLEIHKIVNGAFNGEKYHYDPSYPGYYLGAKHELPVKKAKGPAVPSFDPDAWLAAGPKVFLQKTKAGDKFFGTDGQAYEVTGLDTGAAHVTQLGTGKKGQANLDAQVTLLVAKEGYVPPAPEAGLGFQPGMVFGMQGLTYTITSVLKNGDLKIKQKGKTGPSQKMTEAQWDALSKKPTLHQPALYNIAQDKKKLMDFAAGEKFSAGSGLQQQKPYLVVGPEGKTKVKVLNLLTGEESILSRQKKYHPLVLKGAAPAPEPEQPSFNFDAYFPGGEAKIDDINEGTIIVSPKGTPYKLAKKGPKSGAVATNLLTGKPYPAIDYGSTWKVLTPKAGNDVPYEYLKPGDDTTVLKLKAGDQFKPTDSDIVFEVVTPATEKDNASVKPVYEYGYGAESNAHASPDTVVQFAALAGEGIKPDTSKPIDTSTLPNASTAGFLPFKSSHGTGGKWKHEKVKLMSVGSLFADKSGKTWVVKKAGSNPVVSDGAQNYAIDGEWRGKEYGQPGVPDTPAFTDHAPPLGAAPTNTAPDDHQFAANDHQITIGDMKPGQWYSSGSGLVKGKLVGPDPDNPDGSTVVELYTANGPAGTSSVQNSAIPTKVDVDAEPPDTPAKQTVASYLSGPPLLKKGDKVNYSTKAGKSGTLTILDVSGGNVYAENEAGEKKNFNWTTAALYLQTGQWALAGTSPTTGIPLEQLAPNTGNLSLADLKPGQWFKTSVGNYGTIVGPDPNNSKYVLVNLHSQIDATTSTVSFAKADTSMPQVDKDAVTGSSPDHGLVPGDTFTVATNGITYKVLNVLPDGGVTIVKLDDTGITHVDSTQVASLIKAGTWKVNDAPAPAPVPVLVANDKGLSVGELTPGQWYSNGAAAAKVVGPGPIPDTTSVEFWSPDQKKMFSATTVVSAEVPTSIQPAKTWAHGIETGATITINATKQKYTVTNVTDNGSVSLAPEGETKAIASYPASSAETFLNQGTWSVQQPSAPDSSLAKGQKVYPEGAVAMYKGAHGTAAESVKIDGPVQMLSGEPAVLVQDQKGESFTAMLSELSQVDPPKTDYDAIQVGQQFQWNGGTIYTVSEKDDTAQTIQLETPGGMKKMYTAHTFQQVLDKKFTPVVPTIESEQNQQPEAPLFNPDNLQPLWAADYMPKPGEQVWVDSKVYGPFLGELAKYDAANHVAKVKSPGGSLMNADAIAKVFTPFKKGDAVETPHSSSGVITGFDTSGDSTAALVKMNDSGDITPYYLNALHHPAGEDVGPPEPALAPNTAGTTMQQLAVGDYFIASDGNAPMKLVANDVAAKGENFVYAVPWNHPKGDDGAWMPLHKDFEPYEVDKAVAAVTATKPAPFQQDEMVLIKDPADIGFGVGKVVGANTAATPTGDLLVEFVHNDGATTTAAFQPDELAHMPKPGLLADLGDVGLSLNQKVNTPGDGVGTLLGPDPEGDGWRVETPTGSWTYPLSQITAYVDPEAQLPDIDPKQDAAISQVLDGFGDEAADMDFNVKAELDDGIEIDVWDAGGLYQGRFHSGFDGHVTQIEPGDAGAMTPFLPSASGFNTGQKVTTPDGPGTVLGASAEPGWVKVQLADGPSNYPAADLNVNDGPWLDGVKPEAVKIEGYKSAWGSGGKYKHEHLNTLPQGTKFHGKGGMVWFVLEHIGNTTVVNSGPGTPSKLVEDNSIRVRPLT